MRYELVLALIPGLTCLASGQDPFSSQPECAINCLKEFIPQVGCSLSDVGCQCDSDTQARLQQLMTPCLLSNCNASELIQAVQALSDMCAGSSRPASVTPTPISISSVLDSSGVRSTIITRTITTTNPRESDAVTTSVHTSSSTSVSSTSSASSPPTKEPSPSGLSPAAIGLGVGIGIGGLAVILLALFLFRRHRKRRAAAAHPDGSPADPIPPQGKVELPDSYITEKPADQDPTKGRAEAPSGEARFEVATNEGIQGRHELGGGETSSWRRGNP